MTPLDRTVVVLEALFAGIGVEFESIPYYLKMNAAEELCVSTEVSVGDDEDFVHMEVDFDLGDFLKAIQQFEESYLTKLAHQTALVKIGRTSVRDD